MKSSGGGWTLVNDVSADVVDIIAGSKARQMLKCLDFGSAYVVSPVFDDAWSWSRPAPVLLAGTWDVNGAPVTCGAVSEYTELGCSWWGFGCGTGLAGGNKVLPGVSTVPLKCADDTSAHTGGTFSICGKDNYGYWSTFVRTED
ncbi:MAG: hypothetical protein O2894_13740 [Planctomycetota bacterium]|nr:hypothetical protein [Planctomycetota bacterium]